MFDGRVIDDVVLLGAWCRGDRDAGAQLFERHYASVARFFHNKANETAQGELIQDTFLACLKSAARFRGTASFRAFLLGIARNVLAEHRRQVSRRNAQLPLDSEIDIDELPAVSFGLSPVASAIQREEQRLLLEALRRIPPSYQIALELHYWEELTTAEIGEVLGIPLGTVRTRLRDGRAHLEKQLRKIAGSPEVLQSTLDNLKQWAERVRTHLAPGADAKHGK